MADKDPPIEELAYITGVKVVDIGDIRVARGMSRRPASSCKHLSLRYDTHERRIWCPDCEQNIEGYDAFVMLVERIHTVDQRLATREANVNAAEATAIVSLATKAIDRVWRGRRMVPTCPSCRAGLFPEDFKNGLGMTMGRDYAAAYREKAGKPVPGYAPLLKAVDPA